MNALTLTRLGDALGIAAEGVDLNRPLAAETRDALRAALLDGLVLCIRGQALAPYAFLAAMRAFGTPITQVRQAARHPDVPEIMILSSEDRDDAGDGKRLVVGAHWHSDDSYKAIPCSLTMLYGVEVPASGGDTQFINMYRAHDDLPGEIRRQIAPLRVIHKYDSSRKGTRVAALRPDETKDVPDVVHPLVRTPPDTARKALYLNPNRMECVVGARAAGERCAPRSARPACNTAAIPVPPSLAPWRRPDLGQSLHHAQGQCRLSGRRPPLDASHHRRRHGPGLNVGSSSTKDEGREARPSPAQKKKAAKRGLPRYRRGGSGLRSRPAPAPSASVRAAALRRRRS
ncbi:MAG TPA: TauD/TfdA family dioxygenase [Stellaceae bacterium]|nr:TauD/TfdA family dioxygenase [Stellaceae bacterium]